jgi:uncharacterized protein involved in exopolysaccharide biosynthesis
MNGSPELGSYLRFVARNLIVILVTTIIGAGAGIAYFEHQPKRFTAVSSVAVTPLPTFIAKDPAEEAASYVTIDTDAQVLRSTLVLLPVAKAADESLRTLRSGFNVTASPLSSVLHVSVTASTPTLAEAGAKTAAEQLLVQRAQLIGTNRKREYRLLTAEITALERQVPGATNSIDPTKLTDLNAAIITLRQRFAELQAADREVGRIIVAATPPQPAGRSRAAIAGVSGALIGMLLGVYVAKMRDRRRRRSSARHS